MASEIDTAQQRAEQAALATEEIWCAINQLAYPGATIKRVVARVIQDARRDALEEAANVAFDHECDDPQWCNCNSAIYKQIDRLREGV